MNPLDAISLSLATFYIAYAISSTHGPFNVFDWLREHMPLGGLTKCIVCLAPWCAAVFYLLLIVFQPVVYVFAAAGASVFIWRYTGGANIS